MPSLSARALRASEQEEHSRCAGQRQTLNLAGFGIIIVFRKRRPSFKIVFYSTLEIHHG
jgi:hypothetical protein